MFLVSAQRVATSAITIVIACACALSVPFSQLRTVAVVTTCCCPDAAHCHCPHEQPDRSRQAPQPQLRACHRSTDFSFAPDAPPATAPRIATTVPLASQVVIAVHVLPSPHDGPPTARPDAPS